MFDKTYQVRTGVLRLCVCLCVCAHAHTCVPIREHVYLNVFVYMCMHACMLTHIVCIEARGCCLHIFLCCFFAVCFETELH